MRAQAIPSAPATALRPLPFTGPWLLAPMEGITDPVFRDLVLERHRPEDLGGAFTEFVRVIDRALPEKVLRRHLGPRRFAIPVGVQLMGSDLGALAATARAAVRAGAPLVDLNFGCPAKGALKGCAGSALLRDPAALGAVVRATFEAVGEAVPVTAKIRAGFDDDSLLEDLAASAEANGAALLTVHCRTRKEGYRDEPDWERIARAVAAVAIPVCGNGGVRTHADLEGMRRATGCAYVMVGHGALADPWIFAGRAVSAAEAARFLLDYEEGLRTRKQATPRGASSRVKQLLRVWTAGGLVADEEDRWTWLHAEEIVARLRHVYSGRYGA
ncbi:MAG: tRNA-dihydrouridine synthase family protein [Planctomycetota bacterium]|nr:MAG: tRNA-dihydrouridine synthase family protein [Planctomycetota bacterium]